jgi:hypothetical protein
MYLGLNLCVCVCVYVYVHVCVRICMYVCVLVYDNVREKCSPPDVHACDVLGIEPVCVRVYLC